MELSGLDEDSLEINVESQPREPARHRLKRMRAEDDDEVVTLYDEELPVPSKNNFGGTVAKPKQIDLTSYFDSKPQPYKKPLPASKAVVTPVEDTGASRSSGKRSEKVCVTHCPQYLR